MEAVASDVNIQDTSVVNYINEIKTHYEKQINEKNKTIIDLLEYKDKYEVLEEKYKLLLYKRFMRSAEQLKMLLAGIDFFKAHKELFYKKVA